MKSNRSIPRASSGGEAGRSHCGVAIVWTETATRSIERRKNKRARQPRREGMKGLKVKGERRRALDRMKMAVDWIDSHMRKPRNRFLTMSAAAGGDMVGSSSWHSDS